MAELDATDERIVTLLMRNARATFAEIGRRSTFRPRGQTTG